MSRSPGDYTFYDWTHLTQAEREMAYDGRGPEPTALRPVSLAVRTPTLPPPPRPRKQREYAKQFAAANPQTPTYPVKEVRGPVAELRASLTPAPEPVRSGRCCASCGRELGGVWRDAWRVLPSRGVCANCLPL